MFDLIKSKLKMLKKQNPENPNKMSHLIAHQSDSSTVELQSPTGLAEKRLNFSSTEEKEMTGTSLVTNSLSSSEIRDLSLPVNKNRNPTLSVGELQENPLFEISKKSPSFFSEKRALTEHLVERYGSCALNEITLLNSGNSLSKDCVFHFVENKELGKSELLISVDYEASPKHGSLSPLCEKHNVKIVPEQVMREWFKMSENKAKLELQHRSIVNARQAVGPPPFTPYASVSTSLVKNFPLTAQVWLFVGLLVSTLFSILSKKRKTKNI